MVKKRIIKSPPKPRPIKLYTTCIAKVELSDWEIKHIERALKDHYKDEWCSCCSSIADKLGFSQLE